MRILTVTGNKPMELNIMNENDSRIAYIKQAIQQRLISLLDEGLHWVLVTGQMGVELWTCQVVLDLKKQYDIKLGIFPPFMEFEARWPDGYQALFQEMIAQADFYQPLYQQTYQGPHQFINKDLWLIHKSDGSLILVDEEHPGSVKYFLEKAKHSAYQSNYSIQYITPNDLEEVVQDCLSANDFYETE
nr:SLOG family protein [Gracilibacillus sp. YIM 98692]